MNLKVKNIFLSILIVLLCGMNFSFAQLNQTDAQGRKQGKWQRYFANSNDLRYEGQFKNDKAVGKFIYYYPGGKVRAVMIHDEVKPRTVAYYYHENDTLAAYGIYRSEKKDSIWVNFLDSGWPSSKEEYKNGELNGERTTYYGPEVSTDGSQHVLRKSNFKNGRLDGAFIEYFPDGVVKEKGEYKNGVPNGVIVKNHPNGKMMIKERWKNRQKHGWWVTYDESGKELGRKYYREGQELEDEELKDYLQELKKKGINPNN